MKKWHECCTLHAGLGDIAVYSPDTQEELRELMASCRDLGVQLRPLGNGSNVVGRDDTSQFSALRLGRGFASTEFVEKGVEDTYGKRQVRCGTACQVPAMLRRLAAQGAGGLSELSGIPGSLGGALKMNAGALGVEIGQAVLAMRGVCLADGKPWLWRREQGGWAYRTSPVPDDVLLLEAVLSLDECDADRELARISEEALRRGRVTPPGASAGSVFRNPVDTPAGRLLEEAGCKGLSRGRYCVSPRHANWIVNESRSPGRTDDCLNLVADMAHLVKEKFHTDLKLEWKCWL